MISAQVVETSVTNNSSFQNYPHPDDHTIRTTDTSGLKPFTNLLKCFHIQRQIALLTKITNLDIGLVLIFMFLYRDGAEIHKLNTHKNQQSQYWAFLTGQAWSINDLLYGKGTLFLLDPASDRERAIWYHLARTGSQSEGWIQFILTAQGANHTINANFHNCRKC